MSRDAALRRARALKTELERLGVRTSIELQTGRSGGWNGLRPHATLGHHIASRRSQGITPFLSLIKRGRLDLPGPLANMYLGFDGVARIITMDWANHSGAGGPWTVPGVRVPANNGRPYLFGVEIEGGYSMSDWPPWFRDVQARCFAAALRWMGRDERSHGEHGNPWATGRKFDRIYYYSHLAEAHREIRSHLSTPEDDMPLTNEDIDRIWAHAPASGSDKGKSALFLLQQASRAQQARDTGFQILGGVRQLASTVGVDEATLGAAIAAALLPDLGQVVAAVVEAQPDRDAAEIAEQVVDEMSQRLAPAAQ